MGKILDYVRWRGDLTLDREPFNSLDAGLFAAFAYLPFDPSVKGHTLEAATKRLIQKKTLIHSDKLEAELVNLSNRYKNMHFLDWSHLSQKKPPVQFTAMTIELDSETILVAYRGTDGSMVGLNEDVDMSYQPEIFGQSVAADYLDKMAQAYPDKKIYTVGHSKGGNFAAYALLYAASPSLQDRVIKAYSFDGPGFMKEMYNQIEFQRVIPKMMTYVPEGSIFGMMLDHPERVIVVKSRMKHLMKQHNPLHWEVARNSFVMAPGLSNASRIIRSTFISWNTKIPREKREAFWLAFFTALESQKITEASQLTTNKIRGAIQFSHAYLALDPDARLIANEIISDITATARQYINLPFLSHNEHLEPLGNDSSKGPIVDDSYDGS
ncbi:Mbeg1-like protein [Lactobacillus paragasseri]|uniref:Mbeg1-like protein n=1 Tax=Lactobacillus paragasseri TaxID=2107999 RepID=UPI0028ECC28A|nr:Mbeg1-like protein [Lactobacillus paragasseri]MDT9589075.1 Mbeg1-like protein [Lactobacillus paragasseri]